MVFCAALISSWIFRIVSSACCLASTSLKKKKKILKNFYQVSFYYRFQHVYTPVYAHSCKECTMRLRKIFLYLEIIPWNYSAHFLRAVPISPYLSPMKTVVVIHLSLVMGSGLLNRKRVLNSFSKPLRNQVQELGQLEKHAARGHKGLEPISVCISSFRRHYCNH